MTLQEMPPADLPAEGRVEEKLPADIAAEQAVLGGMIRGDEETVAEAVGIVGAADFYRPAHAVLFGVLRDLADRGLPRDAIALNAELAKRGESARTGGAPYLHTLTEAIPATANTGYYARIVADKARLRSRLEAALHLAQLARADGEAEELVERMDQVWEQARTAGEDGGDEQVEDLEFITPDVIDPPEDDQDVIAAPYKDLTAALDGGWRPGELVILGGRPAHGKTTIALDAARAAARGGHRVLFCSLEMSREEIGQKITAAESRVLYSRVRNPKTRTEEDYARLRDYVCSEPLPITVDHRAESSVSRIRGRVRAMRRQGKAPEVVVVDYLQLMSMPGRAQDSRAREVDEATRQLKLLAKDEGVVVIALSQVNRESAKRDTGMPQVSELRESGGIEQNANIVLLIHNPSAEDKESPAALERAGEIDIKIGKNRNGAASTVVVAAQMHYSRCVDLAWNAREGA
mgnify:CR=1 FL=1